MTTSPMLDAALDYAARGYAVHWLRPRSKAPVLSDWAQIPVLSPADLRRTYRPAYNVGIHCGHWSQPQAGCGVVVADVDIRAPAFQEEATAALEACIPNTLEVPVVLSGRGIGSRHNHFACPLHLLSPKANITIAHGPDPVDKTWKIEVLSTGKQVVCPPSIHPDTGRLYRWAWPEIMPFPPPFIPQALLTAVQTALDAQATQRIADGKVVHGPREGTGERPGDVYNRKADWRFILSPYGWVPVRQRGDMTEWRRPGKDHGISATTNYAGSGLLYVFSTSAAPFAPDTGYTPFAAVTLLEYGGDYGQAARQLAQDLRLPSPPRQRPRRPEDTLDFIDPWLGKRSEWHGIPLQVRRSEHG